MKGRVKGRISKRMQGTPQPYLPPVVRGELAASPNVNSWLKGRP